MLSLGAGDFVPTPLQSVTSLYIHTMTKRIAVAPGDTSNFTSTDNLKNPKHFIPDNFNIFYIKTATKQLRLILLSHQGIAVQGH